MKTNELWLSRRRFITSVSVAMMSLFLAPWQLKAAKTFMLRKTIPGTADSLPVIGLGSSRTFDVDTDAPVIADFVALIQEFFAQGGELIDSSPMYGSAEQIIGMLLSRAGDQDQLFAATNQGLD